MKILPIGQLVKTNPIQTQSNPIAERVKNDAKCVFTKDYEYNADMGYKKTNPNKPNLKAFCKKGGLWP